MNLRDKEFYIESNMESHFNSLAELCKMGDIQAMLDIAHLFFDKCTDEQKQLLSNYEKEQSALNIKLLSAYMSRPANGLTSMKTYMTWIIRAAIYGNKIALMLTEKCPIYKDCAGLDYYLYFKPKNNIKRLWTSDLLREAGFIDILKHKEDCGLVYHYQHGYFRFFYMSDYEPPDEEGFGSEIEYDSVYYDEFFKILPVNVNASEGEVLDALNRLTNERETYWKNKSNSAERKYKVLLSEKNRRKHIVDVIGEGAYCDDREE